MQKDRMMKVWEKNITPIINQCNHHTTIQLVDKSHTSHPIIEYSSLNSKTVLWPMDFFLSKIKIIRNLSDPISTTRSPTISHYIPPIFAPSLHEWSVFLLKWSHQFDEKRSWYEHMRHNICKWSLWCNGATKDPINIILIKIIITNIISYNFHGNMHLPFHSTIIHQHFKFQFF